MNNIKQKRIESGLTQEELSKQLNISVVSMSRYETGVREPRASELKKMAEVLVCSIDELLNPPLPSTPNEAPEQQQGKRAREQVA